MIIFHYIGDGDKTVRIEGDDDDAPISTYSPKKSIKRLFDSNLRLSQTLRFPFSPSANLIDLYMLSRNETKQKAAKNSNFISKK